MLFERISKTKKNRTSVVCFHGFLEETSGCRLLGRQSSIWSTNKQRGFLSEFPVVIYQTGRWYRTKKQRQETTSRGEAEETREAEAKKEGKAEETKEDGSRVLQQQAIPRELGTRRAMRPAMYACSSAIKCQTNRT